MTSDLDWAVESAARAMYVSRNWKTAISEPDGQLKAQDHYEAIVGGYWDSGRAGYSMYQEFRALAAVAVPAATPGILSDVANEVENSRIEPSKAEATVADRLRPLLRGSDVTNWLRRRATADIRAEFVKTKNLTTPTV
jgi:hypothetical protein